MDTWAKKQLAILKEKKEKKEREDSANRDMSTSDSTLSFIEVSTVVWVYKNQLGEGSSEEISTRRIEIDKPTAGSAIGAAMTLGVKDKKKLEREQKENQKKEKKKLTKEMKEKAKEDKKKEKAEKATKKKQDNKVAPTVKSEEGDAAAPKPVQKKPPPAKLTISRGRGKPASRPSILDSAISNADPAANAATGGPAGGKVTRSLEEKHRMLGTQLIQVCLQFLIERAF